MSDKSSVRLAQSYPTLTLTQRREIMESGTRPAQVMLCTIATNHIKALYVAEYERRIHKPCIWRWHHQCEEAWRELARGLMRCEADFSQFMDFCWAAKPPATQYPTLSWMKSMLTVDRFVACQGQMAEMEQLQARAWQESDEYQARLKCAKSHELMAEQFEACHP